MRTRHFLLAATMSVLVQAAVPASAASAESKSWDGLVEVNSPKLDVVFLAPGADFRGYSKVKIDQPEVAFQKNWMRNMNTAGNFRRVSEEDAKKILSAVQSNTSDIFSEAFAKAGYAVVAEAGEDVLRVRSGVVDLYVNAPDTLSASRGRTFTTEAGEATLVIELRDSLTNALLARVLDRRETRGTPGMSSSVSNLAEYRDLARRWAGISVKGLDALKSVSPIPDPLTPGQKLK